MSAKMLAQEVASCNETAKARARLDADAALASERRRLEAAAATAAAEREAAQQQLARARDELAHARAARADAVARADAEREANARWQAHMEEALTAARHRLVARTEQLLQIGLQLDGVEAGAGALEAAPRADGVPRQVVDAVASALREEREAHLCAVCLRAERSTVLLPCRHAVLCATCASTVRETSGRCPLCRADVDDVIRTFG